MSAEKIREAAQVIRRRQSKARAGRWYNAGPHISATWYQDDRHVADCEGSLPSGNVLNAEHIALWDPTVAEAVAVLLEATARELDALGDPDLSAHPQDGRRTAALAVALRILREDQP